MPRRVKSPSLKTFIFTKILKHEVSPLTVNHQLLAIRKRHSLMQINRQSRVSRGGCICIGTDLEEWSLKAFFHLLY